MRLSQGAATRARSSGEDGRGEEGDGEHQEDNEMDRWEGQEDDEMDR